MGRDREQYRGESRQGSSTTGACGYCLAAFRVAAAPGQWLCRSSCTMSRIACVAASPPAPAALATRPTGLYHGLLAFAGPAPDFGDYRILAGLPADTQIFLVGFGETRILHALSCAALI